MTFYEQELRKIVGERYPDATYVGRACYVRLSDMNRAKIQFVTGIVSNQYNALQMTILNRSEGQVDTLRLRFSDLLGTKVTSNPNFRNGVDPHIWDDYGKVDWYVYHPTRQDYEKLSNAVSDYLEVFQDMSQSADQQWAQTMYTEHDLKAVPTVRPLPYPKQLVRPHPEEVKPINVYLGFCCR